MVDNKRRPARAMLAFFNSEHDSIWVQLFDLRSCTCMLLQSMLDRFYGWGVHHTIAVQEMLCYR
ncbi:MAG: hypothetical protein KatS3mg058_2012 [Roseiflexus sp.]|nr:MAG: hypothetical protein KatS3mg058_2012 [Roseiflexus sp.]